MISRRKIFGVLTGLAASVAAIPAFASRDLRKWSGKTVLVTMKVVEDDEILTGFVIESRALSRLLDKMQSSMATYMNTGIKE